MKHAAELVWQNRRLQNFWSTVKRIPGESNAAFQERRRLGQDIEAKYIQQAKNSDYRLIFNNGSFIKVDGAENYANADGIEPHFMVYDEFKSHDYRYNEAMEPNFEVHQAPLLIIGTPPDNNDNYYVKIRDSFKAMDNYSFYQMPSYMNNFLYPKGEDDPKFQAQVQKYVARGEWDVAQRELYAKIVLGGARAIFPMFRRGKFCKPRSEFIQRVKMRPKRYDFYVSFDPGTTSCFAVLFIAIDRIEKTICVIDEIYEKDQAKTTAEVIFPEALKKMEFWQPYLEDWYIVYDYAAAWFAQDVINKFDYNPMPCQKDLKNKEAKLSLIKDAYNANLIEISDSCENFCFETENYIKDEKGKIPKENDHLLDNFRYILNAAHYFTTAETLPDPVDPDTEARYYSLKNDPVVHDLDGYADDIGEYYE
jgi:hypothetical protein